MQHSKEALDAEAMRLCNVYAQALGSKTYTEAEWIESDQLLRDRWKAVAYAAHRMAEHEGKREYKLQVVENRLGVAHLRIVSPYNGEIIFSGETLYSPANAERTAEKFAVNAKRGFAIMKIWEGPQIGESEPGIAATHKLGEVLARKAAK